MNSIDPQFVVDSICSAIRNLWLSQPDINCFVPGETRQREPNLSFHLANEIWKFFPGFNCDFDITKAYYENNRPDIVFHKRWNNDYNLLVIEVKRKSNDNARRWNCTDDETQIRNEWFQSSLKYKYGASIVLDENNHEYGFALFMNGTDEPIRIENGKVVLGLLS